ncbi:MAG: hypothetical protein HY747_11190 [Elusimicrobia bacterium]|nr:hypothetical protein [Elusimicrobiota bacterium]
MTINKILVLCPAIAIMLTAGPVFGADKMRSLKVGSWATYDMNMGNKMTGGVGKNALDAMAQSSGDLPPGITPEIMKMMTPEQLADMKKQMAQYKPQMDAQKEQAKDLTSGRKKSLGLVKIQVIGEETRNSKKYVRVELVYRMDLSDMLSAYKGMKDPKTGKPIEETVNAKLAEQGFPGGIIKVVMQMVVPKPPEGQSFSFDTLQPVELVIRMGTKPAEKMSQNYLEATMSGEAGKTVSVKTGKETKTVNLSKSVQVQNKDIGAKATAMRAGIVDKANEFKGVASALPGLGDAAGMAVSLAVGAVDGIFSAFEDVNIKTKKLTETKSETEEKQQTEDITKIKSKKTEILGDEKVDTKAAGTVAALHARIITDKEVLSINKESMKRKETTKTVESKKVEGQGAGAKITKVFVKEYDKESTSNFEYQTGMEIAMRRNETATMDYYLSPAIPGMGLVKFTQSVQTASGFESAKVGGAEVQMPDFAAMGVANPTQQEMEQATEFLIKETGDSGAKSEL